MKKVTIKDNKICEVVGLAKKPVELGKVVPVPQANFSRLSLRLNPDEIKEGVYEINGDTLYYKSAPKRVMQHPLDVTIVTNDEITRELVFKRYDYWVPETKWKLIYDYGVSVRVVFTRLDTPMFPYLTNVFSSGNLCIGGALAGIDAGSFNKMLENSGEIVNSILCGTPNTDLKFAGLGESIRFDDVKSRDLHKFFLQLSFIHQNVIHNQEEARLWWEPIIKSMDVRDDLDDNMIYDFFYDIVNVPLYDEALLDKYSLENQEKRVKDGNYEV